MKYFFIGFPYSILLEIKICSKYILNLRSKLGFHVVSEGDPLVNNIVLYFSSFIYGNIGIVAHKDRLHFFCIIGITLSSCVISFMDVAGTEFDLFYP